MKASIQNGSESIKAVVENFLLKESRKRLIISLNAEIFIKAKRIYVCPSADNLWSVILKKEVDRQMVWFFVNHIIKDRVLCVTVFSGDSYHQEVKDLIGFLESGLKDFVKEKKLFLKNVFFVRGWQ